MPSPQAPLAIKTSHGSPLQVLQTEFVPPSPDHVRAQVGHNLAIDSRGNVYFASGKQVYALNGALNDQGGPGEQAVVLHTGTRSKVSSLATDQAQARLAVGFENGEVKTFNVSSTVQGEQEELQTFKMLASSVSVVAFFGDGILVAGGGSSVAAVDTLSGQSAGNLHLMCCCCSSCAL